MWSHLKSSFLNESKVHLGVECSPCKNMNVQIRRSGGMADAHGSGSVTSLTFLVFCIILTTFVELLVKKSTSVNESYRVKIEDSTIMRMWRNWQTRMVQVHVNESSCRFKSCYPHHKI